MLQSSFAYCRIVSRFKKIGSFVRMIRKLGFKLSLIKVIANHRPIAKSAEFYGNLEISWNWQIPLLGSQPMELWFVLMCYVV